MKKFIFIIAILMVSPVFAESHKDEVYEKVTPYYEKGKEIVIDTYDTSIDILDDASHSFYNKYVTTKPEMMDFVEYKRFCKKHKIPANNWIPISKYLRENNLNEKDAESYILSLYKD